MPNLAKARRRDARRNAEPVRKTRRSGPALKASRQARRALEARYGDRS